MKRFTTRLFSILLTCFTLTCLSQNQQLKRPPAPVIRRMLVGKTQYLAMDDIAKFYGFAKKQDKKNYTYSSKYTTFNLAEDSREATLSQVNLTLAFAPTVVKGLFAISQADFNCYLEPILRPQLLPKKNISRIVIDPGHGGKDPGCKGGTTFEKNVNLAVATKLAQVLAARGYTVGMTRTTDKFISLKERVALATKFKPDVFISLHCNAAGATVQGIEVYCATPQNTPASDAKVTSTRLCKANAYDKQNAYIAYQTQKQLVNLLKVTDRGVKHKRYSVITDLAAPCILIEMGFLSNQTDRTLLTTPAHQLKLATAVANAVDTYKGVLAPPKP
ncbi:MAG: N-acetylmuramoyl-L-alanine amidase, partial [Victivallales bacterium]|nr:N-acetylmuramoyl-L-alanine amidase [Victivallales bacterium]